MQANLLLINLFSEANWRSCESNICDLLLVVIYALIAGLVVV